MEELLQLRSFSIGEQQLELYVPDQLLLEQKWKQQQAKGRNQFPYWAQVWPTAFALARFINDHPVYTKGKKVLEIAAGLGLPSFIAARYAASVLCTDHAPEAIRTMQRSIAHNTIPNIHCRLLDWKNWTKEFDADLVLMSDVNYDPAVFDELVELIQQVLSQGSTILLGTPQRLMAKSFIASILPYCIRQEEIVIPGSSALIAVLVLRHP